jgi:hypothetical protein
VKDNSKKTSSGFKDLLKEKCPCIWMAITPPISATNSSEHSRIFLSHGLLTTRRARKKSMKATTTSRKPDKTVNVMFGGLPTKRSQKLTLWEVLNIEPGVPTPLRWSEVPITFSHADQWIRFSEPRRFLLVLKPVVAGSKLNKVLIDGGSGLNVLFTKTLKKMKLDITDMLTKSASPFYGFVLGNAAIPLGSVVLPVTFGIQGSVGEFRKTRHPRNVESNRIIKVCFSGAGNSRI